MSPTRSPFDYSITLGKRCRLRDDAPPAAPEPLPAVLVVSAIVGDEIEFHDATHPSNLFRLST
jgi:hypothetical protein